MRKSDDVRIQRALAPLPGEETGAEAAVSGSDAQGYGEASPPESKKKPEKKRGRGRPRNPPPARGGITKLIEARLPLKLYMEVRIRGWESGEPGAAVAAAAIEGYLAEEDAPSLPRPRPASGKTIKMKIELPLKIYAAVKMMSLERDLSPSDIARAVLEKRFGRAR